LSQIVQGALAGQARMAESLGAHTLCIILLKARSH
jgi:hypothetical protein